MKNCIYQKRIEELHAILSVSGVNYYFPCYKTNSYLSLEIIVIFNYFNLSTILYISYINVNKFIRFETKSFFIEKIKYIKKIFFQ